MPLDLFEALDEFESAVDQARETDTLETRRANLESLKAKGGVMGELASELLVAMDERAEKAKREAAITAGEDAMEAGADISDPVVQEYMRQQVLARREADSASYFSLRRQELVARGLGEASVESILADDKGSYGLSR